MERGLKEVDVGDGVLVLGCFHVNSFGWIFYDVLSSSHYRQKGLILFTKMYYFVIWIQWTSLSICEFSLFSLQDMSCVWIEGLS